MSLETNKIQVNQSKDKLLDNLKVKAKEDENYQSLKRYIIEGFPKDKRKIPLEILQYWSIRDQLSIDDDLILFDSKILIPEIARREVLNHLHSSHQGIEKTRRARQIVYWPGINNDIANIVSSCRKCL